MSFDLNPELGAVMTIGGRYYSRYHPNRDIKKFWEGAERHELLIKKCDKCGVAVHPSRISCPRCLATELGWVKSAGRGSIYSFTVIYYPYIPELKERVPYTLALVMLDEGVVFYSVVVNCDPGAAKIGMPVEVTFDRENLFKITLPKFRPSGSQLH